MYGSNMEHDCFQHMTNTGLLQPPGLVDALNHWHCFLLCQLTAYSVIKTAKQLFPSILWKPDSPETIFYDSPNPVNSLGVAHMWMSKALTDESIHPKSEAIRVLLIQFGLLSYSLSPLDSFQQHTEILGPRLLCNQPLLLRKFERESHNSNANL